MTAALAVSTLPDLLLEAFPDLQNHKELIDEFSAFARSQIACRHEEDGEAEFDVLCDFIELQAELLEVLEIRWSAALRLAGEAQLDSLILAEYASAQVERKLALRHLQTAALTYGEMLGLYIGMFDALPPGPIFEKVKEVYARPPSVIVEQPDTRLFVRLLVALLVGSEAANAGALTDLTFWSHRALTSSRQVRTLLVRESRMIQGVRARLKADVAWADWDDEEIAAEIDSWQEL